MNSERYTQRAQGMIQSAQLLALREGHQRITPEHLTKVLLDDEQGLCRQLSDQAAPKKNAGQHLQTLIQEALDKQPKVSGGGAGQVYLAPEVAQVFETAEKAADKTNDRFVTAEMLFLALSMVEPTKSLFAKAGLLSEPLNQAIQAMRKGHKADSASAEDTYDALNRYARD